MRGTLFVCPCMVNHFGITPAYAGNTVSLFYPQSVLRDHPRLCGEHFASCRLTFVQPGSPPLMRGTLFCYTFCFLLFRITPAYAGNTCDTFLFRPHNQDHPRLCGEHGNQSTQVLPLRGSPPLMRGTRHGLNIHSLRIRITPAYAGNTSSYNRNCCRPRDHPRLCGEHYAISNFKSHTMGSPPLMRGTPMSTLFILIFYRITPAYAGNT